MKKDKRNILIFVVIVLIVIFISYFVFSSGITDKLKASAQGMKASVDRDVNKSDLPIINEVINSSGENLVNTNVSLIINTSSKYNIKKVEYSFDLKNWKIIEEDINKKEASVRLNFSKTMNESVYIRVENDRGYKSYPYETIVNIDKDAPVMEINNNEALVIYAKDNIKLSKVQYSYDKLNWDSEDISGEEISLRKENFGYKYIRVVDSVGNISRVKEVK